MSETSLRGSGACDDALDDSRHPHQIKMDNFLTGTF